MSHRKLHLFLYSPTSATEPLQKCIRSSRGNKKHAVDGILAFATTGIITFSLWYSSSCSPSYILTSQLPLSSLFYLYIGIRPRIDRKKFITQAQQTLPNTKSCVFVQTQEDVGKSTGKKGSPLLSACFLTASIIPFPFLEHQLFITYMICQHSCRDLPIHPFWLPDYLQLDQVRLLPW